MYIKYSGFTCSDCGNLVDSEFNELHFDFIDGEILENEMEDIVCEHCGTTYRLDDIEIIPKWKEVTSLD